MANYLNNGQSTVVVGLGSWLYTIGSTNLHFVSMTCTEVPPSGLTLTIAQTGSTSISVSSPAPASAQQEINLQKVFNCVAGDLITFTLSSSAPIDEQLNTVKTQLIIRAGL
jgi:hypothetical protein